MLREKPGSAASSDAGVAIAEPGRISPPTYLRKVVPCSSSAAPQRSIASDSARRTLSLSKGGRLVLKTTVRSDSHGLSVAVTRSPIVSTSSSRCSGVTPRNSAMMPPLL